MTNAAHTPTKSTPEQFQRALDLVKNPYGIESLIVAHDGLVEALKDMILQFLADGKGDLRTRKGERCRAIAAARAALKSAGVE